MGDEISRIGVVGAGVMGSEIAFAAAQAGVGVALRDVERSLIDKGIAHVRAIADRRVARGRMTEEEAAAIVARVAPAEAESDLAGCGLVVEAVTEVMDVKLAVFAALDAATPPGTLLASNTSGLSISELGRATSRPDRVLGLHFFNPASTMKLVEVIRGDATSDATAQAGADLVRRIGKTPVAVAECPGFLVNRVLVRALCESYRCAAQTGADLSAADAAVVEAGPAPMGPFALGDLIGLDTLLHVQNDLVAAYGDRFGDGGLMAGHVAAGRLGAKSGEGFFAGRPPEGATADAEGREVAARYYEGARDEARRCLDEGVASADDLVLAMQLGAGWSGGPLP
ncbi:MAG TPA: 3-hydroxyacyl-CoA dehydrogenase family protein [Miltoncostaeaceae bacterium]|nr:3-hydroxyacyl-CoA dehydrogenase family protein [Miltoncostaeaceae bacterium]